MFIKVIERFTVLISDAVIWRENVNVAIWAQDFLFHFKSQYILSGLGLLSLFVTLVLRLFTSCGDGPSNAYYVTH